jgi:hypothetical protein
VIVWMAKSIILRYGGMPLYRAAVPFFLGLALGHFAAAGLAWGLLGVWTGDAVRGYQVWFGCPGTGVTLAPVALTASGWTG